jgi:hypothetical protein
VPGRETVRFSLDGDSYEIDLTAEEAARLRHLLLRYIAAAQPDRLRAEPEGATGVPTAQIRAWAEKHGLPVATRGSLSTTIIDYYNAVHGRR